MSVQPLKTSAALAYPGNPAMPTGPVILKVCPPLPFCPQLPPCDPAPRLMPVLPVRQAPPCPQSRSPPCKLQLTTTAPAFPPGLLSPIATPLMTCCSSRAMECGCWTLDADREQRRIVLPADTRLRSSA